MGEFIFSALNFKLRRNLIYSKSGSVNLSVFLIYSIIASTNIILFLFTSKCGSPYKSISLLTSSETDSKFYKTVLTLFIRLNPWLGFLLHIGLWVWGGVYTPPLENPTFTYGMKLKLTPEVPLDKRS